MKEISVFFAKGVFSSIFFSRSSLRIVRRAMKNTKVVGGGGAIEMELSRYLREYARTISGKQQLVINYFARALEAKSS